MKLLLKKWIKKLKKEIKEKLKKLKKLKKSGKQSQSEHTWRNQRKFKEKEKIQFKHTDDYLDITKKYASFFDVCFIDGNHEAESIILNDFNICMKVLNKPGYIIWDDYDPNKFQVKKVVDDIRHKHKHECELIEFRGHLFGEKSPEKNAGEVIMKIL